MRRRESTSNAGSECSERTREKELEVKEESVVAVVVVLS